MLHGSCHCQAVKFECTDFPESAQFCHCHTCRKVNGTAFGSSAMARREEFRVISGEDCLVEYESTPGKKRCFCVLCGTHVFAFAEKRPDFVILRLGCLDGDHGIVPQQHIWASHKAPWYEIPDALPIHDEW